MPCKCINGENREVLLCHTTIDAMTNQAPFPPQPSPHLFEKKNVHKMVLFKIQVSCLFIFLSLLQAKCPSSLCDLWLSASLTWLHAHLAGEQVGSSEVMVIEWREQQQLNA